MKKRILTMFLAFVMMLTLVSPALASAEEEVESVTATEDSASEEPEVGIGGVDFYSITINYTKEILVDYSLVSKKFLFADEDGSAVMSKSYIYRAGVTKDLDYIGYSMESKSAGTNFYQLSCKEAGIYPEAQYSSVPYSYAYITHIQDNAVLKSEESISFYGITAPYDQGDDYVNHNPNCEYGEDGYAIDEDVEVVKNDDGTTSEVNYRIDINNYRITKDYLWLDSEGARVELYYQKVQLKCTGQSSKGKAITDVEYLDDYEYIPYSARFNENGMIADIKDIVYYAYIPLDSSNWILAEDQGKEGVNDFGTNNKDTATASNPAVMQYKIATTQEEIDVLTTKSASKKYNIVKLYPQLIEVNKEGFEDSVYYDVNTVFTADNIQRDKDGNIVYSTPIVGTPKLNVEIESISVEIDAVGDQIYANAEDDPQNKNTITLSINDFATNCTLKKEALDEKRISQKVYDSFNSMIVGTVNCKTTSTTPNFDKNKEDNKKSTTTSITFDVDSETLNSIPRIGFIYLNFNIETHQPESSYDESKLQLDKKTGKSTLITANVDLYVKPDVQTISVVEQDVGATIALIAGIAAGVIAVAVAVVIIVVKKKKKAA